MMGSAGLLPGRNDEIPTATTHTTGTKGVNTSRRYYVAEPLIDYNLRRSYDVMKKRIDEIGLKVQK